MDTVVSSRFIEITNLIDIGYKEINDLKEEREKYIENISKKIDNIYDKIKGYKNTTYSCPCGKRVKISRSLDHKLSEYHILHMAKKINF